MTAYRLTAIARRRFDEILAYSISRWGLGRAEAYLRDIHRVLLSVARKERRAGPGERYGVGLSFVRSGSHYIFLRYDPDTNMYDVVDVLPQSMDFQRHLKPQDEGD